MLQADTIIVNNGLANFERTYRHEFWRSYDELATEADYDKFVDSFDDNYPGACATVVQYG